MSCFLILFLFNKSGNLLHFFSDTALAEENKLLQQKISINLENLNEKDKVITLLEAGKYFYSPHLNILTNIKKCLLNNFLKY